VAAPATVDGLLGFVFATGLTPGRLDSGYKP